MTPANALSIGAGLQGELLFSYLSFCVLDKPETRQSFLGPGELHDLQHLNGFGQLSLNIISRREFLFFKK